MAEVITTTVPEVVFAKDATGVSVIETTVQKSVITVANTGPQGPAGGTLADKNYTQSFSVATTVVVPHNLGKRVAVTVVDSAGDECEGNVHYDSDNQVTITFSAAFSGVVYCN